MQDLPRVFPEGSSRKEMPYPQGLLTLLVIVQEWGKTVAPAVIAALQAP
jgi:hypothetical protein